MSIATFFYSPFTKNIYRNNELVVEKTKKTVSLLGLLIVPISLILVYFILRGVLKLELTIWFYFIAFLYIYPSYLYGIEIVNLFKKHKEKKVVKILFLGTSINFILSYLFLLNEFGILGALLGSAISQMIVLLLFKLKF